MRTDSAGPGRLVRRDGLGPGPLLGTRGWTAGWGVGESRAGWQGNRLLELGQAELAVCKYRAGYQLVEYEETDDPQVDTLTVTFGRDLWP